MEPALLGVGVPRFKEHQGDYEQELHTWITNGCLIPYPVKKLGSPKVSVLLMAVVQHNKGKVMVYCEQNKHVMHSLKIQTFVARLRQKGQIWIYLTCEKRNLKYTYLSHCGHIKT